MLKKLKALKLPDNGRFPLVISAKLSNTYGEIMMTNKGKELIKKYNFEFEEFQGFPVETVRRFVLDMVDQIQIVHKIGFVNCNLCLPFVREENGRFGMSDFNNTVKERNQVQPSEYHLNILFSPDSVIMEQKVSKRDDLESLMGMTCFLLTGSHPILQYMKDNINELSDTNTFISKMVDYRK